MIARYLLNERFPVRNGTEIRDKKKFLDMFSFYKDDKETAEKVFRGFSEHILRATDETLKYISGKDFFLAYGVVKLHVSQGTMSFFDIIGYSFGKDGSHDFEAYTENGFYYPTKNMDKVEEDYKLCVARMKCYEKYLVNVSDGKQLLSVIRKFKQNEKSSWKRNRGEWLKSRNPI